MKKPISLKWKIARALMVLGLFMIGVLYVFQAYLLEPMYESSKISTVKSVSDSVAEMIQSGKEVDEDTLFAYDLQDDTCVRVIDLEDEFYMMPPLTNNGCMLYRMNPIEIDTMIAAAENSEDKTALIDETEFHDFPGGKNKDGSRDIRNITYTRIIEHDGHDMAIMVYTGFTRVNDASRTLQRQLLYIGIIMAAAIILLTWIMYRQIAKPLTKITEEAKHLPEGRYEYDPSTDRYQEAKDLNEVLQQAAEDIDQAERAKRDLIANVSHDLRTPLTMISGYGEMMIDMPEEKTDENIEVIIDESKRLSALVNDLLDMSRMQEGKIVLQKEYFDLHEMIGSELRKYDVYVREGYQIEYIPAYDCPVYADRKRMEQVFNNFMVNAIHYGGDSKHIIVREVKMDDSVQVQIQDFGEGIAEKDLANIWDRYYKVDKQHVRSDSGSGIGLSIVRSILELHEAKYGVNSEPGKGSTFWFELPLEKQTDDKAEA